jgi:hypothetical protein
MKKLLIILTIFFSGQLSGKPYDIYLDKLMQTSKFKGEVIIIAYELNADSSVKSLKVAPIAKPDSIFSIKAHPNDYWGFKMPYSAKPRSKKAKHSDVATYWPNLSEKILIVVDSTNALALFGEILGDKYRLYGNYFTGSATGIHSKYLFSSPLKSHKFGNEFLYITAVYITRNDLKTKWTS